MPLPPTAPSFSVTLFSSFGYFKIVRVEIPTSFSVITPDCFMETFTQLLEFQSGHSVTQVKANKLETNLSVDWKF